LGNDQAEPTLEPVLSLAPKTVRVGVDPFTLGVQVIQLFLRRVRRARQPMRSISELAHSRFPASIPTAKRSSSEPAPVHGHCRGRKPAERLYVASLVMVEATVRALLSRSPDQVSLVAMGDNGIKRTDEDELCAIHLRNRLEGRPADPDAIRRLILAGGLGNLCKSQLQL
jgi:hypothetical protein